MLYQVFFPVFPLSQFIECFIYYRGYTPDHSIDRFLPDGNVNVVIDLTESPKFIYDNDTLKEIQACRRVWFSGMRNGFITIPSGKDSEMLIINFHKGMAYPFVEMPMDELTDVVVDGQLVMTDEILTIRDKLLESNSPSEMFSKAQLHLNSVYCNRLVRNPCVEFAIQSILDQPDHTSMSSLTRKIGYSQKHFIKLFKEQVGVTPKSFLRIIRFQSAIQQIEKGLEMDWPAVAHDSGYYDQAHFITDFRQFSGFTPRQYLGAQSEFKNYVAVR